MLIDLSMRSDFAGVVVTSRKVTLELGLYEEPFSLSDTLRFHTLQRQLDLITWPSGEVEITLFHMKRPLRDLLRPADDFAEWLQDHPEGDIDLFARDLLVSFLVLLMPMLPEEAKLVVQLDRLYDKAHFLRLAHPAKWAGMVHLVQGSSAVLLPPESEEALAPYEQAAEVGINSFITEEDLHNSWQGLDLLYITQAVTKQGLRSIKGFEAAQGQVLFLS